MPQTVSLYRALIASPSDCSAERSLVREIIHRWNAAHSVKAGAAVEPVLWETHVIPELGDRPQSIINRQLLDICDFLVGIFWTRLGTHTVTAASGTAEEIDEFRSRGKRVLLYFSQRQITPSDIDMEQYNALLRYKRGIQGEGITFDYSNVDEFERMFSSHLQGLMASLHPKALSSPDEADVVARLYKLVDTYAKYSVDPPAATHEEYEEIERWIKDWIFEHKIDADPDLLEAVVRVITTIRAHFNEGRFVSTLVGGSGRPEPKILHLYKSELIGQVESIAERIRARRGKTSASLVNTPPNPRLQPTKARRSRRTRRGRK